MVENTVKVESSSSEVSIPFTWVAQPYLKHGEKAFPRDAALSHSCGWQTSLDLAIIVDIDHIPTRWMFMRAISVLVRG